MVVFRESALAHHYLDGKKGIEIGGSYHNQFGLDTLNVSNSTPGVETPFTREEMQACGNVLPIDVVADACDLPFEDESLGFVINSHVLEHIFDPIKAINEWMRVIKPGGYIFMIIPHKERMFDKDRPRTELSELIDRHNGLIEDPNVDFHHNVWITNDILVLCTYMDLEVVDYQNVDDKVGNGFTIVIRK